MDPDLKLSYSHSGAIHVLAVSGLHVGVIFVVLNFLFSLFFGGNKTVNHIIRVLFVLVGLWGFALLTGASPSVLRSALMFSFFQFAFLFQRPFYLYASLFSSMLILLLYDPHLFFNVGFQLSYAAVLSILFFQPRISSLFVPKNRVLSWMWNMMSVSFAAQIGTAPLVLYYFHQFSYVFWLSAFVVVPLSAVLIGLTGLTLVTYPVSFLSDIFAYLLDKVAMVMNGFVSWLNQWTFACASDLYCPFFCLCLLLLAIVLFAFYCSTRRPFVLICSLASVLVFLSGSIVDYSRKTAKNTFAVYYIPGFSAVNAFSVYDNVVMTDNMEKVVRKAKPFWLSSYAASLPVQDTSSVIRVGERTAFVLNKEPINSFCYPENPLIVDYLVVSNNVKIEKEKLSRMFSYKRLIIDSSCSSSTAHWWLDRYNKGYVVKERGSFIEQF